MEREESRSADDGVDEEVLEAVSGAKKDLKITRVQLKIVGEDLSLLQDFKEELELILTCQGPACRVCFQQGLWWSWSLSVHAPLMYSY